MSSNSTYLRVKDMPEDLRPREKAMHAGIGNLANAELLALLLGSGTGGLSAVHIGVELLKKYHDLFALSRQNAGELEKMHGIGPARAITLCAAFELGRRVAAFQPVQRPKIGGPEDVFRLYGNQMAHFNKEILRVIVLNTRNEVIAIKDVSSGVVNSTAAHPREIFKAVIDNFGTGLILIHNHPSQDPTPSAADRELTRRIAASGKILDLPLLDHLILAKGRYYSFKNEGLLEDE